MKYLVKVRVEIAENMSNTPRVMELVLGAHGIPSKVLSVETEKKGVDK